MPSSDQLAVHTRVRETHTSLLVAGDLDLHSAPDLRVAVRRVLDSNPSELRIDLSTVPFVDSTGLGVLVGVRKACVARGLQLVLVPSARVRMVLERTGLLAWFGLR